MTLDADRAAFRRRDLAIGRLDNERALRDAVDRDGDRAALGEAVAVFWRTLFLHLKVLYKLT